MLLPEASPTASADQHLRLLMVGELARSCWRAAEQLHLAWQDWQLEAEAMPREHQRRCCVCVHPRTLQYRIYMSPVDESAYRAGKNEHLRGQHVIVLACRSSVSNVLRTLITCTCVIVLGSTSRLPDQQIFHDTPHPTQIAAVAVLTCRQLHCCCSSHAQAT